MSEPPEHHNKGFMLVSGAGEGRACLQHEPAGKGLKKLNILFFKRPSL